MKYCNPLALAKATQYRQRIARYGKEVVYNTEPISFENWFLNGIRNYEAKGAEFELLPGIVKITWPGKVPMLRTVEDFKSEYNEARGISA